MASTYSTVRYKDSGDSVKQLQTALNSAGYDLEVDGIFGSKTLSALKQYQGANGLTVDGIAGEKTWGALQRGSAPDGAQPPVAAPPTTTEPPSGEEGLPQGDALTDALNKLMEQYNSNQGYTQKTPEEIKQQASSEYESYYDQLKLAAEQQQQTSDLYLKQQQEGLQATFDKQREESQKQYEKVYSQTDRQMLSRGMQRSSYAAQTLANISQEGAEAQQAIADQQAAAEGDIAEKRTLLAQQLASQLAQYDASEAADVLNRIRELEEQEYDRGVAATDRQNSLATQLYQLIYQQQRDQVADKQHADELAYQQQRDEIKDQQWQQQFDESVRQYNESKKKSSGGSSKKATAAQTPEAAPNTGMSWNDFVSSLGGSKTSSSGSSLLGALGAVAGGLAGAASITNALKKTTGTTGGGSSGLNNKISMAVRE